MRKKIPFFIATCFLLNTVIAQKIQTLRIDPDNAMGGTVSQMLDSVTYIPLENTKESEFGMILNLHVTDRYFLFTDYDTKSALIFDKKGHFHKRLRSDGFQIKGLDLDPNSGNIILQCENDAASKDPELLALNPEEGIDFEKVKSILERYRKLAIYNSNGDFLHDSVASFLKDESFGNGRTIRFGWNNMSAKDSIGYFVKAFKNKELLYEIKPFKQSFLQIGITPEVEKVLSLANGSICKTNIDTVMYCTMPFDYSIYRLGWSGYTKAFQFVFPMSYSLPSEYQTDTLFSNNNIVDYLKKNDNVVGAITDFYIRENYMFFNLNYPKLNNGKPTHMMYSLSSNTLYDLDKMTPDAKNYFLPLNTKNGAFSKGSFYYEIPSYSMLVADEENADRKVQYPDALKSFFAKKNKKGNPVIVQLRFKQNL